MEKASRLKVDIVKHDYRGFVFVVHEEHGLMLLRCTRKKNKPPHWQLPGGHVDDDEFLAAAEATSDADEQLQMAARAGAARELYEETDMDFLRQLDRFQPAALKKAAGSKGLPNELKSRLFYFLTVSDRDFPSNGVAPVGTSGRYLHLRLSVEHSDFIFQPEPTEAAEMLKYHSGGKCGQALLMAVGPSSDQKGREHVNKSAPVDVVEIAESKPVDLLPPPQKEKACCFFGK